MTDEAKTYTATPATVAEIYGVTQRAVKRWASGMKVPHCQTPSGPRFNLEELAEHFRREPISA